MTIGPLMPVAKNEKSPPVDQHGGPLNGWQTIPSKALDDMHFNKSSGLNSALRLDDYVALDPDDDEASAFLEELTNSGALPKTVSWSTWRGKTIRLYQLAENVRRVRPSKGMKLEVRCGVGQYVIVPPSIISEIFPYNWLNKPGSISIPPIPPTALERIYSSINVQSHEEPVLFPMADIGNLWRGVSDGARNHTVTVLAGHLLCRNIPLDTVMDIILMWNERNQPPLSEREVIHCIRSINVAELRKRLVPGSSLSQDIREWLDLARGEFHVSELYRDLHFVTKADRVNACQVLNRLVKDGQLIRTGRKRGNYRLMEDNLVAIDYEGANPNAFYNIKWPLNIEKFVGIFPKNVAIIAGSPNAGKTAFLLNVVKNNISHRCTYFSSEMAAEELRVRLDKFTLPLSFWKNCNFFDRSSDYADVIDPDGLNVIDFLEISEDFPRVAKEIGDIYNKLNRGIAVVGLQKNEGTMLGRGGGFSLEKARLYVALDELRANNKHRLTIVKGKNWAQQGVNPNNKSITFSIEDGCKFKVGEIYDSQLDGAESYHQTLFTEE